MKDLDTLLDIFVRVDDKLTMKHLLNLLFTKAELNTVSKRIEIIKMLDEGVSQAKIAKKLEVGIATVTRGSAMTKKYEKSSWWKDFLSWRR